MEMFHLREALSIRPSSRRFSVTRPIPALMALLGWLILIPIMSDMVYGIIFAGVAGIMVFISVDELLPAAREYGEHHLSIYGLIAGMMVMAASLLLFM